MVNKPGGRILPDGRPPQSKGVGKNAKRHDLERPKTPGLHGSDLQQGDVQAMEQGQRIAPVRTQPPAQPRPQQGAGQQPQRQLGLDVPDAIQFFGQRAAGPPSIPSGGSGATGGKLEKWGPILSSLVSQPGTSGGLAQAYISQLRRLRQEAVNRPVASVNFQDIDDGLEGMLGAMGAE